MRWNINANSTSLQERIINSYNCGKYLEWLESLHEQCPELSKCDEITVCYYLNHFTLPPLPAISLVRYEVKYWGIYSWQELPIKFLFLGKSLSSDSYSHEMGNLAHHCQLVEAVIKVRAPTHSFKYDRGNRASCVGLVSSAWPRPDLWSECCPGVVSDLDPAQCSALLSAPRLILNGHMLVSACFPCP